ncbi:MAG: SusC/RagA family TonB-linked outer membrane protein [Dysgonamonadaceae bacterium]|jgi:TonB-linked SusC/RagA family outer membrane protein|nr:SusC/RagA family TonB-linked outer membrane protein [Dysgonamonadaceae bacterium]
MKKRIEGSFVLFFMLIFSSLYAQTNKLNISGTVTDATGEPLIGASVLEKGTTNGTVTDLDGQFTLTVSPNAVLTVSYMGYVPQDVKASGQSPLKIKLAEDVQALNEVVVTALGIKKQAKVLGYAVSEVKSDQITAGRDANAITALSGKLAGVDISTTAGGPSGSTRVIIRGNSQLTGSNMPLYVVDGLPMDNTQLGSADNNGGYDMGDGLSGINPDDIESISVLKGPSASALYGSRASNGVVLITTKSGKNKKGLGIDFSTNVNAVSILSHFDDYQRVYGQGTQGQPPILASNARTSTQSAWGAKLDPNMQAPIYNGEMKPYGNVNNNIMSFFRTGLTFTNTLAVSNSNENTDFRFSLSDMRNTDIVPSSDMHRTTLMLKGSATIAKKLHVEGRANYTTEGVNNRPALSDSPNNIGNSLIGIAPNFDQKWLASGYKDEYGRYNSWNANIYRLNPYWVLNEMENYSKKDRWMGLAQISYDFTDYLSARVKAGTDYYNFHFTDYAPRYTDGLEAGRMQDLTSTVYETNYEAMVQFNKRFFNEVLDVSAFVGDNIMQYNNESYNLVGKSEVIPGIVDIMNYSVYDKPAHGLYRKQINSVFGSINLGYKNFLYLDMTFRNDVSSTLYKDNRSYFYPSVSGSFIFSEITNLRLAGISFAKLRASWAKVGGDTDPYRLNLTYGLQPYTINGQSLGAVASTRLPNRYLKPTSTYSYETGIDVRFFDNRLNFDLGYYHQSTVDQILDLPLTSAAGYTHATINAGEIVNQGIELAVSSTPVKTNRFEWTTNINLAKNSNKIVSLHPEVKDYLLAEARWAGASIYATEGQAYGSIVGKKFKRNENGDIIFNAQGMPTFDNEVSILGNGNYNFTLGFGNTFRYQNLSLGILFDMKFGGDIYSMSSWMTHANGTSTETLAGREEWYASEEARRAANKSNNEWTPTGGFVGKGVVNVGTDENPMWETNTKAVDPQTYWQMVTNNTPEPFIFDASYVKLRELTLSYSFPKSWLAKFVLQDVAITAYGRNLWILYTKLKNVDPESNYNNGNGQGFEYGSLPSRRTFGLGISVKF